MNQDSAELEKSLIAWVEEWNAGETQTVVDADTNLSHTGLLDSMAVVGLVAHLEEQSGTAFDFATFDYSDGVTVRGLVQHCVG
ncbi:phosphopantetheine-binding protein [Kitasatospora sp. NPDC058218]|uniref:phosphopantetheine-binding protein n=1 Tax=Kitasatospora sp. NPDC058218 TaxID=3346385 RepID=UPI0036D81438